MKTYLNKRFITTALALAFLVISTGQSLAITNSKSVVSPYWQSDSASYSFIAISHSSLSSMASQIGVKLTAIQSDQALFGTALSFTVNAGATQRIFVVRTQQSSINPTSITSALFISGTTNFKHGHILVEPIASNIEIRTTTNNGDGFTDITMLTFWGGVVIETNTTGFAMEFIGDVHDSSATSVLGTDASVSGVSSP